MPNALVSRKELVSGLKNVKRSMTVNAPGLMPLLNITKTGKMCFGTAKTRLKKGEVWAVRPETLMHGFIAWHNGAVEKEIMVPAGKDLPSLEKLPSVQAEKGYEFQVAAVFVAIKGPNAGTEVNLKKATKGVRDLVDMLTDEIIDAADAGNKIVPYGRLWVDSYHHKKYGETFTPELEIQGWMTPKSLESRLAKLAEEDEAEDTKGEEKARRAKPDPEDGDEDDEDDEDDNAGGKDTLDDDDEDELDADDDPLDDDHDDEDEDGDIDRDSDEDDEEDEDEDEDDDDDDSDDEEPSEEDKPAARPRRRVHRR